MRFNTNNERTSTRKINARASENRDHGGHRSYERHNTDMTKFINNTPLIPVNADSIAAAKPVAHGAVPHRIECCCTFKNRLL